MSGDSSGLASLYLPQRQLICQSPEWQDRVLGLICYSIDQKYVDDLINIPCARVDLPVLLGSEEGACESFMVDTPLSYCENGAISFRRGENILWGCLTVDESNFSSESCYVRGQTPLAAASEFLYRNIFRLLKSQNLPFLYRVWNYLPDINAESHGIERYRQFNSGRENAFRSCHQPLTGNVPAASALGSFKGSLNVSFLAGSIGPVAFENPRQISAYHYPDKYGPCPPLFSRANLVRFGKKLVLFISGTASIVGHQSLHENDVIAQCRETLLNIETIVKEANRILKGNCFDAAQLLFKVYVRRSEDASEIRAEINRYFGLPVQALFLQADICRRELLIEIEASGSHSSIPRDQC